MAAAFLLVLVPGLSWNNSSLGCSSSGASSWYLSFLAVTNSFNLGDWLKLAFLPILLPWRNCTMGCAVGLNFKYDWPAWVTRRSLGIIMGFSSMNWISTLEDIATIAIGYGQAKGTGLLLQWQLVNTAMESPMAFDNGGTMFCCWATRKTPITHCSFIFSNLLNCQIWMCWIDYVLLVNYILLKQRLKRKCCFLGKHESKMSIFKSLFFGKKQDFFQKVIHSYDS